MAGTLTSVYHCRRAFASRLFLPARAAPILAQIVTGWALAVAAGFRGSGRHRGDGFLSRIFEPGHRLVAGPVPACGGRGLEGLLLPGVRHQRASAAQRALTGRRPRRPLSLRHRPQWAVLGRELSRFYLPLAGRRSRRAGQTKGLGLNSLVIFTPFVRRRSAEFACRNRRNIRSSSVRHF
ncbi:hypothetical protein ABIB44_003841 [Hymenobacter sp. UYCo722]